MTQKSSDLIRQEFFDFFREKEHLITEGVPVVPQNDPTLLFINAGMNPFKPIFLGEKKGVRDGGKLWRRAANTQRCIRVSGKHNDLEEVGHDTYHHTLFEMLGNWSFGDYFKKEAISWAWELLVDRWGLEPDRLYATVFEGSEGEGIPADEESIALWKSETGIRPDQILRFGKRDNFWEMGEAGPCGPCSEVHIDLRPDSERKKVPGSELVNQDDPRVMEIWNLVFIQYNRREDGSLEKLPAQHVDTGMGFERICAVLQGKRSNYDSDIFAPLLDAISEMAGRKYGTDERSDIAMRVITDHIRAVAFPIADGASPSNEGRGFVIRRILRRAVRYGWDRLEFREPFLYKLVPVLAGQFSALFPDLKAQEEYVSGVVHSEEKSFLKTLGQGIELFEQMSAGGELTGEDAFRLHDTYGFPIDLTRLMAREKGIDVDTHRFEELMQEQKQRARAAGRFGAAGGGTDGWTILTNTDTSFEFVGYDRLSAEVEVTGVSAEGKHPALKLNRSPFYAESGGQVADTGWLTQEKGGGRMEVLDVQKSGDGFIHVVDQLPEDLSGEWVAEVDANRRREISRHHTATHLMHACLREVLGEHVVQKGSLVDTGRLRFDFSHFEPATSEELNRIEAMVNERIRENIPKQEERDVPIEEARKRGAMMLFGEKYGERVRIITYDSRFSIELCGGTHVGATGEIGYFRFLNESSASAGIRRVEAVVSRSADSLLRSEKELTERIRQELGAQKDPLEALSELREERRQLERSLQSLEQKMASGRLDTLLSSAEEVNGVRLVCGEVEGADMDTLKQMGYDALEKLKSSGGVVLLSNDQSEKKVYLMAAMTPDLNEKGLKAGALVSELGRIIGGGGGGQPSLATAGGRLPEKSGEALKRAKEWFEEHLM
ncbi:MAG: alanine--tRNA ligase [Balneolaceae bacterium]